MSKKESKGKRPAETQLVKEEGEEGDAGALSMADFEDAFEDEFDEEVYDDENAAEDEEEGEEMEGEDGEPITKAQQKAWRPGVDPLAEDEVLEFDPSAYHIMHAMQVQFPCLSFSIVEDQLGANRTTCPHTMYVVTGTQAQENTDNCIMVLKISDINKLPQEDSDDEEWDDDGEDDPIVEMKCIPHKGVINKVKIVQQKDNLFAAAWAEQGHVSIYDLTQHKNALDQPDANGTIPSGLVYTVSKHTTEGYALDWAPTGLRLLSGDNHKLIYETVCSDSGWDTVGAYKGHTSSVEDLQWSPTEANVFASASSDKTVKIWDARAHVRKPVLSVVAHESDVNAIAWNKKVAYLLGSGSDDNSLRVWDLRNFKAGESVAHFEYHSDQICSLEWNPHDDTQIIAASADNQVTIWDLSLEADDLALEGEGEDVPPQLFFVHQGQLDVKEAHWHPQIPNLIVSTAADGFNIFKPSNTD